MTLLDLYRNEPDRFKAYLFDIDGTLMLGSEIIPGSREFLVRLKNDGVPYRFLTNNSSVPHSSLVTRLGSVGIEAEPDDFVSSDDPLPEYFRSICKPGIESTFFAIGRFPDLPGLVRFEHDPAKIMDCDGVLHCGGVYDWQKTIPAIMNFFIRHPERPFLISNPDMLNPLPDSFSICANGQMELVIRMLESRGIHKERILFGKPCTPIYQKALERLALPPGTPRKAVLAVGDLLSSDILGANRFGFASGLVLTGCTTKKSAADAQGELRPDLIFERLA